MESPLARLGVVVLLIATPFATARAESSKVDGIVIWPPMVPDTGGGGAFLFVRTDSPASEVVLDLGTGGCPGIPPGGGTSSVPMLPLDALPTDRFVTLLDPADLVLGFGPVDVNRNVFGCIRVTDPAGSTVASGIALNVDDGSFPDVAIEDLAPDVRCAPHVVNILLDGEGAWGPAPPNLVASDRAALSRFYEIFGDDYDFANVVYVLPSWGRNRGHCILRNPVTGIGGAICDDPSFYGSASRLLGYTRFPLDTFFDLAETTALHELGHQWINFLPVPLLDAGIPHWPPSTLARGIMGWSNPADPLREGLAFGWDLVAVPGGLFELQPAPLPREYTELDLYLMGLLPADAVDPFLVVDPPDQPLGDYMTVTATEMTVDDVTDVLGPRLPDATSAPHDFTMATIVVTRARALTDREMAFFDHFAARGEATTPLPFSVGLSNGTTKPFLVATQGIGSLQTSIDCPPVLLPPKEDFPHPCPDIFPTICPVKPMDPLFEGLDYAIVAAEVRPEGLRTSLHAKVVKAGEAYSRGKPKTAARKMRALLKEIQAQEGRHLAVETAGALEFLVRAVADRLGIPLGGKVVTPGP